MIENPFQILMGILVTAVGVRFLVAAYLPAIRPRAFRTGEERIGVVQCWGIAITLFGLAIIAFIHDPANPPPTIFFAPAVIGFITFILARILEPVDCPSDS